MERPPPDLHYTLEQFRPPGGRDALWHLRRMERAVLRSAGPARGSASKPPRVLDVACGTGTQLARLRREGWEPWGVDASDFMLRLGQYMWPEVGASVPLVRGLAESLPFQEASFDLVLCQGSLDHFTDAPAFLREAARVLAPGGRLIVALANYESLACRLGRAAHRLSGRLGLPSPRARAYWRIPEDHTFRGSYGFLTSMGDGRLELTRVYGVSLLQAVGAWRTLLHTLPLPMATALWTVADHLARLLPALADTTVAVWRRPPTPSTDSASASSCLGTLKGG
jgi:SAM-dependent methyltransferase